MPGLILLQRLGLLCLLGFSLSACGPLIGIYLLQGPDASFFGAGPTAEEDSEPGLPEAASANEAAQEEQSISGRKAF